jgi:hypothetical protein
MQACRIPLFLRGGPGCVDGVEPILASHWYSQALAEIDHFFAQVALVLLLAALTILRVLSRQSSQVVVGV